MNFALFCLAQGDAPNDAQQALFSGRLAVFTSRPEVVFSLT